MNDAAFHRRRDLRRLTTLAWPILIGQLAVIANGVIDTAMTSRFSATDLAALAVGASIYVSVFVGASGVLQALGPLIGQLFGAGRHAAIGVEVKQGAWLALLLTVLGSLVLAFPQPFLALAHASPSLTAKASLPRPSVGWKKPTTSLARAKPAGAWRCLTSTCATAAPAPRWKPPNAYRRKRQTTCRC